jgi:hypothetical protein
MAMLLAATGPAGAADVTLVGAAGRAALSDAEQTKISAIVKREAESCSLSSVGYPEILRGRDAAATWQTLERGPHIYVRYETPVVIRLGVRGGAPVLATEVLTGLDDPKFPRQPLTRHAGVVTMHGKCDGLAGIELMCLPALRPYFERPVLDNNCAILQRVRRRS